MADLIRIHPEVRAALEARRPVVALETTLVSHGFPSGEGGAVAAEAERRVRAAWAVPATIGVIDGVIQVGLEEEQLARFADTPDARKVGPRDLAACRAGSPRRDHRGGTLAVCRAAGIRFMATGGLGGVHRGWTERPDISADLGELARTEALVVASGAKSILDVDATAELLETIGVPVLGWRTDTMPLFYSRDGGPRVSARVLTVEEVAQIAQFHWRLGRHSALLLARPTDESLDVEPLIQEGVAEAEKQGVRGPDVTPFILAYLHEASSGATVEVNKKLIAENAALAAEVAVAYSGSSETPLRPGRARDPGSLRRELGVGADHGASAEATTSTRPVATQETTTAKTTTEAAEPPQPQAPPASPGSSPATAAVQAQRCPDSPAPIGPARRDEERLRLAATQCRRGVPEGDDRRQGGDAAGCRLHRADRDHAQARGRRPRAQRLGFRRVHARGPGRTLQEIASGSVCWSCHMAPPTSTTCSPARRFGGMVHRHHFVKPSWARASLGDSALDGDDVVGRERFLARLAPADHVAARQDRDRLDHPAVAQEQRVWCAPQASWGHEATSVASHSGSRVGSSTRTPCRRLPAEELDEVVDLEHLVRLRLHATARPQRDRDLGDDRGILGLDDVDEVVRAEHEPLVDYLRAQLLDVLVDLSQAVRVRAERLQP